MTRTASREKRQRKCPHCGQVFFKGEHLARHIRSHTKERPFSCKTCGKAYSRHDSLLRHSRIHDRDDVQMGQCDHGSPPSTLDNIVSPRDAVDDSINAAFGPGLPQPTLVRPPGGPPVLSPVTTAESQGRPTATGIPYTPDYIHHHPGSSHDHDSSVIAPGAATAAVNPSGADHTRWLPASIFNTPTNLDYLDVGLNNYEPTWLLGQDFDIDAFNFSITSVIPDLDQHGLAHPPSSDQHQAYAAADVLSRLNAPPAPLFTQYEQQQESMCVVQRNWYTRLCSTTSPRISSEPLNHSETVDDRYRETLSHRLQPPVDHAVLPSADFLNLCIKLYFARFNPVFPLIHAPSFRPSSENALLLLSICSMGALFVGTASAASQGRKIFQVLNKAVLASWETYLGRDRREALSLTQAALIGQTFGMLSGHSQDLCLTESFSGTVISWARQSGCFKVQSLAAVNERHGNNGNSQSVEEMWKSWAHAEEAVRLVLGLHVHDSEFAAIFHHEPLLRHTASKIPVCCSEELFSAPTAAQWHRLLGEQTTVASNTADAPSTGEPERQWLSPQRSQMFRYAALAGILVSIQERKETGLDVPSTVSFRNSLLAWHREHIRHVCDEKGSMGLMVLWHAAFMALYVDFELLERAIGSDGTAAAAQASDQVRAWAGSSEARRGVLHALLVLKHIETLPIGLEPGIHVPRSLFYSAIVTYCYITFGASQATPPTPTREEVNVPELQTSEPPGATQSSQRGDRAWPGTFSAVDSTIICSAMDLLRRIGHWEISRRFASILEALLGDLASKPAGLS